MKNSFNATPLKQAPSLSATLGDKLRQEIESRRLDVGAKFPTDAEIAKAFGVSRTVVREAVSALRAEGLVTTQRGRGSVVASRVASHPFGITQEEINSIDDVLRVSEVRRTLECETASLASQRRTPADIEKLKRCLKTLESVIDKGEDAVEEDIDLHITIAHATQNEYFPRLLASFSSVLIARRRVRSDLSEPQKLRGYLDIVQAQHHQIVDAIIAGDAETASAVMRKHLDGSRYQALLAQEMGVE